MFFNRTVVIGMPKTKTGEALSLHIRTLCARISSTLKKSTPTKIVQRTDVQKVNELLKRPNYPQKTKEWFQMRKGKVTASDAACILPLSYAICKPFLEEFGLRGVDKSGTANLADLVSHRDAPYNGTFQLNPKKCANPYSSREEYILKKCGHSEFTGNVATNHGVKYEQVACDIYARLKGVDVYDLGLIEHEKFKWLGASPDGITRDGTLLEIKVPYRREPKPYPPFYYWVQMQLQLACCLELDHCDFIECIIKEFSSEDEFLEYTPDSSKLQQKGIILEVFKEGDSVSPQYIYPEKDVTDTQTLLHWANTTIYEFRAAQRIQQWWKHIQNKSIGPHSNNRNAELYNLFLRSRNVSSQEWTIAKRYWRLDYIQVTAVKRSAEWFNHALPYLHKAWQEVNLYKSAGIRETPPDPSIDPKFHALLYKKYRQYYDQQALRSRFMFVTDASDPNCFSIPP